MNLSVILPDETFLPAAQQLIDQAERKIWISTFKAEITTKPRGRKLHQFFDTLYEKAHNGVEVRCLTNRPDGGKHIPISNEFAIRDMARNRVQVRYLPHGRCCHSKLLLTDTVGSIIGSHNLSVKSCRGNSECSLYFIDPRTDEWLREFYERTWETAIKI